MREEQQEKKHRLPADLAGRLAAYSATAGAVLAVSSPAASAIHAFTPQAVLTVDSGHAISVDMDMDGTKDFTLSFFFTSQTSSNGKNYNGSCNIHIVRNHSENRFDGGAGAVRRLEKGDPVRAAFNQDEARLMGAFKHSSTQCTSLETSPHCFPWRWSQGEPFNKGAEGYIGVKFRGGDGRDHNGWILFQGGTDPAYLTGSVLGWAYEDSTGGIRAGSDNNKAELTFLPDFEGNSAKAFAVLKAVQGLSSQTSVLISSTDTGSPLKEFPCLDAQFHPVTLTRIDNIDGSGNPGLAILAVKESPAGKILKVKAQLRAYPTGKLIRDVFFDKRYAPKALFWLNDMNGNGRCELALLGTNPATGKSALQIKDSQTGALLKTILLASDQDDDCIDLWTVPDLNSNGSWEIAVLERETETGRSRIEVVDPQSLETVKTIPCLNPKLLPLSMAWVRDMNQNGFPEQAILARTASGDKVVVEIRDMLTGEALKTVSFNRHFAPEGFATADLLGDKTFELAVLSTNPTTGSTQIEVRNPLTGGLIKTVPVP